jgi:hypothetical protein
LTDFFAAAGGIDSLPYEKLQALAVKTGVLSPPEDDEDGPLGMRDDYFRPFNGQKPGTRGSADASIAEVTDVASDAAAAPDSESAQAPPAAAAAASEASADSQPK